MIPATIGIFILVVSSIFFNQIQKKNNVAGISIENSSEVSEVTPSPSSSPFENPSQIPKSTNSKVEVKSGSSTSDVNININANSSSSDNTNKLSISINDLKYPGSSTNSQSENSLELESSDSPDNITNWYKDKIRDLKMNTKSFVTTKSNDNILNKLAASNGMTEVNVEVKKDASWSLAKVKVNLVLD